MPKPSLTVAAARLQSAYQVLLRPAARAALTLETYGAAELRDSAGPMLFLVGDDRPVDRTLALSGLPRSLRRRTVPAQDARQATKLLERDWNVVVAGEDAVAFADVAVRLRVPIIPVGVRGTVAAIEPGRILPQPGRPRVAVRYGLPLTPKAGETVAGLAERATAAVRQLVAEDVATWWAVRRHGVTGPVTAPGGWRRTWQQTERPQLGGRRPTPRIWQG